MKHLLHFLVFNLFCSGILISQSTQTGTEVFHEIDSYKFPQVITSIESLRATLPKRVDTVASAYGDLNKDGIMDLVVVVSLPYTTDYPDDMPYEGDAAVPLAVYLGQKNGFSLLAQSKNVILCQGCGGVFGNPFSGIEITKDGKVLVYHYGGSSERWAYTDEFSFVNNSMYLTSHSFTNSSTHTMAYTTVTTNYKTGEQITEWSNGETNKKKYKYKKKSKKVKIEPLVSLENYNIENQ